MEVNNNSPVVQFYHDKTVFITGATGFMGKVLVEKLLRSTNVKRLLLLIRPKKGVQTEQRLKTLLATAVFDRIREIDETLLDKVEAVNGDITEGNLGIDDESKQMLTECVHVVFHCAATVRFDEDLTKSVAMNVEAVLAILELAKNMKKLEALVDVSTAYCNCDLKDIDEEIYPPPGNPKGLVDVCKWMDSEKLNSPEMTKIMVGNRPNTYTFTKALAENVLKTEGRGLPVVIIRPSIVTASWKEPFPGWVDNFNGPTGVIAAAGKGVMRTMFCKRSCVADMVPVDVCINLTCVLGWKIATHPSPSTPPVFNCTSGGINPITWGNVETWGLEILLRNPFEGVFWYPGGSYKENWYLNRMCQLMFHYGPAHGVDLLYRLIGRKPFLAKVSNLMQKSTKALEPFTSNSWNWSNTNVIKLEQELTQEDRDVFGFDIRSLNWKEYLETYVQGIRKFLFKEDPSTIPSSKRHLVLLYWLDLAVQILFVAGVLTLYRLLI